MRRLMDFPTNGGHPVKGVYSPWEVQQWRKRDAPTHRSSRRRLLNSSPSRATPVADITCIPSREGWLYLAAVEDLYSRRIVGWAMADHLESRLVVDALTMAVQRRLPHEGMLAHSDRSSQYASDHYHAPMESFFASLNKELVHDADFATPVEARAAIFEYIEDFYNGQRRHSSLGYVSPMEHERSATP